ncbi:MAG: response regulator [Magnetococcales bacterium]|nr:response regulator [Magnetococcales bacterium]MBF0149474.1 response regulator [Magnetococcales bacterium]MBF0171863.1 response regulator [Magnetococcales bacterium]MBF0346095.1 response regulator [Magnetococcales bacterium]MBF0631357.1 response regulator [Magnetococcales bacterium]
MSSQHAILIVDDEAELRENLAALLGHEGFQTFTAETGMEGLRVLAKEQIDVVLLDLIIPGMDGIETMQEMRKLRSTVKFIMLTAFATVNTAVQAIRKGASDYLSKPFLFDDLVAVIRRCLEEARFEMQIQSCNLDQTLASLANPIRRRIIEMLGQTSALRMTDISMALAISDHTKTMFHLRILKEAQLIRQGEDKLYTLTLPGTNAFNLLRVLGKSKV